MVRRPWPIVRWFFKDYAWHVPNAGRTVFLTFDDGPTPGVTDEILEVLKASDCKATFFCLGKNVKQHPELYQRIIAEGHGTGNHSFSHPNGWRTPSNKYVDDVTAASELIHSHLFRPPYGKIKPYQGRRLSELKFKVVMWDILSGDWDRNRGPKEVAGAVISAIKEGSIIVFHDSEKAKRNVLGALPLVLDHLRDKSFRTDRLDHYLLK